MSVNVKKVIGHFPHSENHRLIPNYGTFNNTDSQEEDQETWLEMIRIT